MNGVTRNVVRQLVPMIKPYMEAVAPFSSAWTINNNNGTMATINQWVATINQ